MSAMLAAPAEGPARDRLGIASLLELSDPVGVLSVYVDADPALAGRSRPGWQAPVRASLRRLAKHAREWPRSQRHVFDQRLDELRPELEALLDPRTGGRGRALFAGIRDGGSRRIDLPVPLPPLVSVDRHAYVLPLVAAQDEGAPAGVAVVSWARIELAEWRLGELHRLETIELAEALESARGRPATNPAVPQPFPERDRFETAVGARIAARVHEAGERLAEEAAARGWVAVVGDGDPRLLDALAGGLGSAAGELVRSRRAIGGIATGVAARRVRDLLRELHARRDERLATLLDGSAATRDPLVVERALAEGRVAHLVLAIPASASSYPAAESLLRRALATGAKVTPIDPASAALDGSCAAALLRW